MSLLNLDDLLGQSLDSVEAAPEFVQLENGLYNLSVKDTKAEKKASKDKTKGDYILLTLQYQVDEVHEQEGTPIKVGSLTSESFMMSEQGLPYFKGRIAQIAVANGGSEDDVNGLSVKEALEAVKGMAFKVNAKQSKNGDRVNVRMQNIRAVDSAE
jgi:hypothetical protein